MVPIETETIYLDHCATTPVAPAVMSKMLPYFTEFYGNASSVYHKAGRKAAEAVELARNQVASLLHASAKEIVFTSGATEAINQSLLGVYHHYKSVGKHIITCKTEHPAVIDTCQYLEKLGAEITQLAVDRLGNISLEDLERSIRKDTILICFMFANNETGVIHPVAEIGNIARKHQILFLCDATQAVGKVPIDVDQCKIDLLALSAHKIYGPKGVGALYIRRRNKPIQIGSLLHGGKQENQLRAGTLNVPGIVGLGAAAAILTKEQQEYKRLKRWRDHLENSLLTRLPEVFVNGDSQHRLPHVSNICFKYVKSAEIMIALPHLELSAGSACASGSRAPSHVLLSMGLSDDEAHSSIRFSLGSQNTEQQIDYCIEALVQTIENIRKTSPIWQMHQAGII